MRNLMNGVYGCTLSLLEGEVAAIEQVGEDGDHEGMPDRHANLVFDLVEDQQQILGDDEDAANHYDCT